MVNFSYTVLTFCQFFHDLACIDAGENIILGVYVDKQVTLGIYKKNTGVVGSWCETVKLHLGKRQNQGNPEARSRAYFSRNSLDTMPHPCSLQLTWALDTVAATKMVPNWLTAFTSFPFRLISQVEACNQFGVSPSCEPRDTGEVFLSYMDLIVGSWAVNLINMTVNESLSSKIYAYTFVFSYLLKQ